MANKDRLCSAEALGHARRQFKSVIMIGNKNVKLVKRLTCKCASVIGQRRRLMEPRESTNNHLLPLLYKNPGKLISTVCDWLLAAIN